MPETGLAPGALRAARLAANLTQVELARLSSISVPYLRLLERNYAPDPASAGYRHVIAALDALGHPPEEADD